MRVPEERRGAGLPPEQPDTRTPPLDVRLANQLMREIVSGSLEPGAWLREQDLAARFEVSRSPIREALRQVAQRGFLVMHPWRGAQIKDLSAEETRYIFDLFEGVYGTVARIAAATYPLDRLGELRAMLMEGEHVLDQESTREERNAVSFRIGRHLGRLGASRTAYDMMMQIGSLALWQHRFMPPDDLDTARRQFELHRVLVDAVGARDEDTAEFAARQMVAITRRDLMAHMGAGRGPTAG